VGDIPQAPRRITPALHEALVPLVAVAAVLGVLLPGTAHLLRPGVPYMLAGQVAGVALTVTGRQIVPVLRRPRGLVVALVAQWILMPAFGYALFRLTGGDLVGQGAFITAVAPAEITSALVAVVAGAEAATAAAVMSTSVALGCILTPLWLTLLGDQSHRVDRGSLIAELVFSVALPLVAGVALRTRFTTLARHPRRWLDLAGISLLLVVFVGAGAARPVLLSARLGEAVALATALIVWGAALGAGVAISTRHARKIQLALAFPVGMREFGIATAVALSIAPRAAGFGGLYGVLMMLAAAGAAAGLRRGRETERR